MRIAVADLGTNSTRLLVAQVGDGGLKEIDRRTDVTRLGDGVDATGRLSDDAMERVHARLATYREIADGHGAQRSVAVATSAVRDAANGEEFAAAVRQRHGFATRVISGDEEARLTFLGATVGRERGDRQTLVFDIGGGSTEYVIGRTGEAPSFDVSTRLGSVRQTERHIRTDPPRADELATLADAAAEIIAAAVPVNERTRVDKGIAVAGTATSMAAIDQRLDPYDPEKVQGFDLALAAAERMLATLAAMPVAARRELPGLLPGRAPTIVTGAVILVESMHAFGLESVEVSDADILHGTAIEAALYG